MFLPEIVVANIIYNRATVIKRITLAKIYLLRRINCLTSITGINQGSQILFFHIDMTWCNFRRISTIPTCRSRTRIAKKQLEVCRKSFQKLQKYAGSNVDKMILLLCPILLSSYSRNFQKLYFTVPFIRI